MAAHQRQHDDHRADGCLALQQVLNPIRAGGAGLSTRKAGLAIEYQPTAQIQPAPHLQVPLRLDARCAPLVGGGGSAVLKVVAEQMGGRPR